MRRLQVFQMLAVALARQEEGVCKPSVASILFLGFHAPKMLLDLHLSGGQRRLGSSLHSLEQLVVAASSTLGSKQPPILRGHRQDLCCSYAALTSVAFARLAPLRRSHDGFAQPVGRQLRLVLLSRCAGRARSIGVGSARLRAANHRITHQITGVGRHGIPSASENPHNLLVPLRLGAAPASSPSRVRAAGRGRLLPEGRAKCCSSCYCNVYLAAAALRRLPPSLQPQVDPHILLGEAAVSGPSPGA